MSSTPQPVPFAIEPIYPFNQPGEALRPYDGLAQFQGQQVPCVIELKCSPKLNLTWRVTAKTASWTTGYDQLIVEMPYGDRAVDVAHLSADHGWCNGQEFGTSDDPQMTRVVVHWLNLPQLPACGLVRDPEDTTDQARTRRWEHITMGWHLIIDARTDLNRVHAAIQSDNSIAMTHVMEIRREDGRSFSCSQVRTLLEALSSGFPSARRLGGACTSCWHRCRRHPSVGPVGHLLLRSRRQCR